MGGIFDIFDSQDYSRIKKHLKEQAERLDQLHLHSHALHKYTEEIANSHIKHKNDILAHIRNLSQWTDYLNQSNIQIKKEVADLRKSLKAELRKDFEAYHQVLLEYLEHKLSYSEKTHQLHLSETIDKLKQEIAKPIINAEQDYNVNNVMHYDNLELNNPEKELLKLLFNENQPMTYGMMASKTGKSINSIRVYMNSIKAKKDVIEEFRSPSGEKIFSIRNSERVKTLFNVSPL